MRYLWEPLIPWLRYHGYELFDRVASEEDSGLRPAAGREDRAPDDFHAVIYDTQPTPAWIIPHIVSATSWGAPSRQGLTGFATVSQTNASLPSVYETRRTSCFSLYAKMERVRPSWRYCVDSPGRTSLVTLTTTSYLCWMNSGTPT